ncbi:MAG TPA: NPCBM/NEW2 domain-containing protein [Tepidisphaeraceae bacterium]|jgi:hypothetical protein|nr:NPCBM/NEW2 domain-containing protein [Tepidisphaeraceae bacterium]
MPTRRHQNRRHSESFEMLESRLLLAAHIVGSSTAYSTIQAAVNAASSGATITVDAGTYPEEVTVSKTLTIKGAQAGVDARSRVGGSTAVESIVTGAVSSGTHSCGFYITANNVVIDGFTVQGETNASSTTGAGIVIAPSHSGTHIINSIVQNNVAGLFLANNSSTNAALIQHDYFANNNNSGGNSGRGIYTDGTVSGGTLTNVTIDSNTFVNNYSSDGVEAACAFQGSSSNTQTNITLTNNTFTGNGKATLFFNTTGVVIENNTITGCIDQGSAALRFEGNNHNVTIMYNTADNNTAPAVAVDAKGVGGNSLGFVINDNNFYNNNDAHTPALSVVFNDGAYTGTFDVRNNWWGSASGPGGDGPGTGDDVSAATLKSGAAEGWNLVSGGGELFSPWLTAPYGNTTPPPPPPTPVAPTVPTALSAVVISATQVNLKWTDSAPGVETGFIVQRSADGVTFSQIATTAANVTSYHDTTATAGTTYSYRVLAANSVGNSPASAAVSATTLAANAVTTYLSTLTWTSATTGYGTIHKNATVNGNPLTLRGTVYPSGIGTHAVSQIVYNLAGAYTNFISDVGVDDEITAEKATGSVDFQVIGDGKLLFDSGVVTNASPVVNLDVNVADVKQLTLTATNGVSGSIDYDHSDWAGARLISTPAPPPAPTLPAAPSSLSANASSPTLVTLNWTDNAAGNETGFIVQRSSDNVNFATIATTAAGVTTYADNGPFTVGATYYYQVIATNALGNSAASPAASAIIPSATSTPVTTYLSDISWTSATVGYATIQKDKSINGNPLTLRGTVYPKGIGTHAVSQIVYALNGQYTSFLSDVGVDDEITAEKATGSVDFQVIGDGKVLFNSGVVTNKSAVVHINVSVAGVKQLTLLASNGVAGSIDYDHADWAGARLTSQAAAPVAPVAPTAPTSLGAVATSSSQIALSWTNTTLNQTATAIDRSTDDVNFTTIAGNVAPTATSYTDSNLSAATQYYYRIRAVNAVGSSPNTAVVNATTLSATAAPAAPAAPVFLSDMTPTSSTIGWGTLQINKSVGGHTLTLRGQTYANGIGTHAVSSIVYALGGKYSTFISDVGIDDEENGVGTGSVDFQVIGDGKILFDSGILTNASPIVHINVSIAGVQNLTLLATNGVTGSIDYDHADWAGAEVI